MAALQGQRAPLTPLPFKGASWEVTERTLKAFPYVAQFNRGTGAVQTTRGGRVMYAGIAPGWVLDRAEAVGSHLLTIHSSHALPVNIERISRQIDPILVAWSAPVWLTVDKHGYRHREGLGVARGFIIAAWDMDQEIPIGEE